jgi:NAD(P)-dependent dehydrogenase (short-subunit alcohol dehydrogenase family)
MTTGSGEERPLAGQVAVVAGATRGAGRGVARALGEAGAIVYCTGRSVAGHPSPYGRPETIDETAALIAAAGGTAVAVRVDHTVEAEVEALFARVDREHGRVDLLVDSVAGEDPLMDGWTPFWENNVSRGDALIRQALLSRLITAKHAARLMVRQRRGLIVELTENDLLGASGDVLTQLVRMAHKLLVTIFATELRPHGVAAVALTPGFMRSESVLSYFGVTEDTWRDAGAKDSNFLESESPRFVGRAVAALLQAPDLLARSGHLFSTWALAREFGFTDVDGRRPDWGAVVPDLSMVPAPICEQMLGGYELQRDWLKVLSGRTDRFLDVWGPGLRAQSGSGSDPSS